MTMTYSYLWRFLLEHVIYSPYKCLIVTPKCLIACYKRNLNIENYPFVQRQNCFLMCYLMSEDLRAPAGR